MDIPVIPVQELHTRLGFSHPIDFPISSLNKSLTEWKMDIDDAPIFRYLYRNFKPSRHLEFGTWQGLGVLYCLEECEATVWTINLPQGEKLHDGTPAYHSFSIGTPSLYLRAKRKLMAWVNGPVQTGDMFWRPSDSFGFIGRYYLDAGLGYRVCQIYCDSYQWDIQNYPPGFFDTALIDGGHSEEIVINDTNKACRLVHSGGLIMWHDFCPVGEVQNNCSSTRGVVTAIKANWDWLCEQMEDIFWIKPSWILLGVKR